jgi:putative ABC transport system permease protein
MTALLADLRFALRQLLRRPGFTLLAVATLALGTGASAAMFGIVDRVLLRPLPFPASNRLVALCETNRSLEGFCVAAPPNVEDWSREGRTLASVGLGREWPFTMREGGASEGVSGGLATPGLFRTLGITPLLGRLLRPDDLTPAGRHVAVLSSAFWQSRFGGDRQVLGHFISLDGERYEIVGVLPPGTEVPHLGRARLWVPLPFDPRDEENRRWRGFVTIGRLAEGVSVADAESELHALQDRLALRHPETNRGWSARAEPLLDSVVGPVRPTLLVFLGAVTLLLIVACTNVANLLVARGVAREREFAVRAAVGARPVALFRLLAVESVALALLGGVAGLFVATWVADALLALMPGGLPRIDHAGFDARTLGVAVLVTLVVGLLTGLAPALRAARLNLGEAMKSGHQPSGWRRALGLRGGLVSAQVALAVVLAVGAGLLTRGYASLLRWEPGFDRSHLLTFWTYASMGTYPDAARVSALFARLEGEMRSLPGVSAVGLTSSGPLFGGTETGEFLPIGGDSSTAPMAARWYDMSPSYLATLRLPLRAGRLFTDEDGPGAPRVVLINEAMARRYFAGTVPVGKIIRQRNDPTPLTIVGMVADIAPFVPGQAAAPEIYWPQRQSPRWASYFVLRTSGDPAQLARAIAARLAAVDPDLQPSGVLTMDDLVNRELARPRFHMLLIGTFAVLALSLTFVGVYGVIAASVAGRTREIGVRIALGAGEGTVLGMVLREGLVLAGIGLAVGLMIAAFAARFAASLLSGIAYLDPLSYAATALLVTAAATMACLVPARRAARVQPTEALRAE